MRSFHFLLRTLLLLALLSGCARKRIIVGKVPPIPRPEYEDSAIVKSFAMQSAKRQTGRDISLVSEGPSVAKLQGILDRLVEANLPKYTYHAFVVADDTLNAFTDGKAVYLHAKLLSTARSDADLVAIVSHELAHITAGHLTYDRKELERRQAAVTVVSAILGAAAAAAQAHSNPYAPRQTYTNTGESVMKISGLIGSAAFIAPYNRDQEREADEIGMMMAARAGYDPNTFVDFWANASVVLQSTSGGGLLDTHPSHADRSVNLKAALPIALQYYECALEAKKPKATPSKECTELRAKSQCSQDYCVDGRVE